jgi:hypothetical protein
MKDVLEKVKAEGSSERSYLSFILSTDSSDASDREEMSENETF